LSIHFLCKIVPPIELIGNGREERRRRTTEAFYARGVNNTYNINMLTALNNYEINKHNCTAPRQYIFIGIAELPIREGFINRDPS
jgi:hypothetical protein